ncbi:DUF502 domain-containing protein [Candidatus Berkiella cookevillensis]|uniref:DUF502 domain-containing protein n=1 Tax=Candidatus Berkiella cookevillensis TaxID=437022 RepID=A0A0Q9YRC3_9GAMM|nr:DUF502 domain-containing protein [Candidatus Berkiella cookevillensis]MCS5707441.1 DUF502 domain-containing protein [Candidatus Berkiella cookevillensis]
MIKRIFWSGLQAFVPIVVTFAVVVWVFRSIEVFFGRFIQYIIPPQYYFDGLGIIVGVLLVFVIGILVNAWLIKTIYHFAESIVNKIPGIKVIYNAVKDFVNFFDKSKQTQAQYAVLVNTALGQAIGFVTRDNLTDLPQDLGGEANCLVYIPLSYQIGGLMVSIPKKDLIKIDWEINQAMSFVITAGMSSTPTTITKP